MVGAGVSGFNQPNRRSVAGGAITKAGKDDFYHREHRDEPIPAPLARSVPARKAMASPS